MTIPHELPTGVGIEARGVLSEALLRLLASKVHKPHDELAAFDATVALRDDPIFDEELQISPFMLYAFASGSLGQAGAEWERDPRLIAARTTLERAFESALR